MFSCFSSREPARLGIRCDRMSAIGQLPVDAGPNSIGVCRWRARRRHVGEHAEEEVGSDAVFEVVVDRAHLER
jgi:hypothetical protein